MGSFGQAMVIPAILGREIYQAVDDDQLGRAYVPKIEQHVFSIGTDLIPAAATRDQPTWHNNGRWQ